MEYPYQVTDLEASGIVAHELNSKLGAKPVAVVEFKDNPLLPTNDIQTRINPGQVLQVDAPSLNTGSGQSFNFWKAIAVDHLSSHDRGFTTTLKMIPWFSGTLTSPTTNLIDYVLPLRYQELDRPALPRPWWLGKPFVYVPER